MNIPSNLRRLIAAALFLAVADIPATVAAGPPTEQLRTRVNQVSSILEDPALRGDSKTGLRRAAIREIADQIFDFEEMAKRSLGRHWEALTATQRSEFVARFTDLLRRSYYSGVERASFDKIEFLDERLQGDAALVRTLVFLPHGDKMGLDYQLLHVTGDRWKVYDLRIEGVSLVANYRSQFNRIIRTSSSEALVTKLKSNQTEFSGPEEAAAAPRLGQ